MKAIEQLTQRLKNYTTKPKSDFFVQHYLNKKQGIKCTKDEAISFVKDIGFTGLTKLSGINTSIAYKIIGEIEVYLGNYK